MKNAPEQFLFTSCDAPKKQTSAAHEKKFKNRPCSFHSMML